jgi:hypothetical protein
MVDLQLNSAIDLQGLILNQLRTVKILLHLLFVFSLLYVKINCIAIDMKFILLAHCFRTFSRFI